MQLFVSDKGFVKVYDVKSKKELINTLNLFCKEVWARTEKSNKVRQFLPVGSSRSSQTSTYVRSYVLFGLQRPLWMIKMTSEDRFLDFKGDLIHRPHSSARK